MSAGRHRCRGCRQTFRRRADVDSHWLRRHSPEALVAEAERSARFVETCRRLEQAWSERGGDFYGRKVGNWSVDPWPDTVVRVEEVNSTLNRLFFSMLAQAEPARPALPAPDLLDARRLPDGTFSTE